MYARLTCFHAWFFWIEFHLYVFIIIIIIIIILILFLAHFGLLMVYKAQTRPDQFRFLSRGDCLRGVRGTPRLVQGFLDGTST